VIVEASMSIFCVNVNRELSRIFRDLLLSVIENMIGHASFFICDQARGWSLHHP
jgi:hypothetical protein